MKLTSEYLFDKPREAYEPHISILASRRIIDAKALMKKLSKLRDTVTGQEQEELIERYQAVEKSIKFWEELK